MPKSTALNFTQNLNNISVLFNSSDTYSLIQVGVTAIGTNLTPGTRTFTAAGGTLVSGGAGAASWSIPVLGAAGAGYVSGPPTIIQPGQYTVGAGPTAAANAAAVDTGSSNATFALTVGILKTLYTASSNDAVVKSINVSSTDSAARVMSLWSQDAGSGVMTLIGAFNIPASSGSNGTAATVDVFNGALLPSLTFDINGKRILPLKVGTKLLLSVPAVTASLYISAHAVVEEY